MTDPNTPYLLADKPAGVPTHSPQPPREGFVEYLQRRHHRRLWVCHRLDGATSGALVLGTDEAATRYLSELFAQRQVEKTYLCVSDRSSKTAQTEIDSHISRAGNTYVSRRDGGQTNAVTQFTRLKSHGRFTLWQARPSTGRPHQIRLHARDLGMPLLGDTLYGGTPFPRLMLHAAQLNFSAPDGTPVAHHSPAPPFFDDLALLADDEGIAWLAALDRRQRLFGTAADQTLRLIHREIDGIRCDLLGPVCWWYWYRSQSPTAAEQQRLEAFSRAAGAKRWIVRHMTNRGRQPQAHKHQAVEEAWTAQENDLEYHFKTDQGLSPGLFLDQRQNRAWLRQNATGLKVLNLFCYTGGFSLNAAAAGASQIVSVDTSKRTLEWARDNFRLNGFDPEAPGVEFSPVDTRLFLRGCRRRRRLFDLIICDPPSFARNKEGVFRIEHDLPNLLDDLWTVLAPAGRLLMCCNYEKWDQATFEIQLRQALPDAQIRPAPTADWDFELPGDPPLMKAAVLTRPA
jgi:23S rRNA (cytosine1962-C5)-methyltransferase